MHRFRLFRLALGLQYFDKIVDIRERFWGAQP